MNGWKNYETWATVCWEEPGAWAEEAKELVLALAGTDGTTPTYIKDGVKAIIAEHFDLVLDNVAGSASLVRDLLSSAIDNIDVDTLAWHAVRDVLEESDLDEKIVNGILAAAPR